MTRPVRGSYIFDRCAPSGKADWHERALTKPSHHTPVVPAHAIGRTHGRTPSGRSFRDSLVCPPPGLRGVGIYGVAAFSASRRAREVAIRMALGATERDVTRLLVRGGARAPIVGLVIGLILGTALSVGAATAVPGVRIADPAALSAVFVVIALLSAVSLVVPVRGLLRGAPMRRLREE